MELVEIDRLDAQPAQAGLALATHARGEQALADLAALVPDPTALGEDIRAVPEAVQGACDDLLGMPEAVDRGGVEPIDPGVQSLVDCRDAVAIVLIAPTEGPTASTDGPGAEAERGEVQVGGPKASGLHARSKASPLSGANVNRAGGNWP